MYACARALAGALLLSLCAVAQTATTPACPQGTRNTPYSYFGSVGVGYDPIAAVPSIASGFGVKTGICSTSFLVTTIATGIGAHNPNPGYAMLTEKFEYHLAATKYWEFIGDGQVGVAQVLATNGSVTTAMFAGGVAIGFDAGYWLSKQQFHLPVLFHADYTAMPNGPAGSVKPAYFLDFRKTF